MTTAATRQVDTTVSTHDHARAGSPCGCGRHGCYWPMLKAAVGTGVVVVGLAMAAIVVLAQQAGATISIERWYWFPALRIHVADAGMVNWLELWGGAVALIVAITVYARALLGGAARQIRVGTSFGFLDVAGIGLVDLLSHRYRDTPIYLPRVMAALTIGGTIAFALAFWLAQRESDEAPESRQAPGSGQVTVAQRLR